MSSVVFASGDIHVISEASEAVLDVPSRCKPRLGELALHCQVRRAGREQENKASDCQRVHPELVFRSRVSETEHCFNSDVTFAFLP